MTHLMENGQVEPRSATKTSWSAIHEKAPYSKKKIKSGAFRSVYFRHPEEKPKFSAKTWERKAASAAKIEAYRKAGQKYRVMVEEPAAKVDKQGRVVVQHRGERGKFAKKIILLS
jgi:hypothetical protein